MRPEGIVLKYKPDASLLRRYVGYSPIADEDVAALGFKETRDRAQRRRLAATRRSQQGNEFAVAYPKIEMIEGRDFSVFNYKIF